MATAICPLWRRHRRAVVHARRIPRRQHPQAIRRQARRQACTYERQRSARQRVHHGLASSRLDTIEEEWNKKVDMEVEILVDGMVDLVSLASVRAFRLSYLL